MFGSDRHVGQVPRLQFGKQVQASFNNSVALILVELNRSLFKLFFNSSVSKTPKKKKVKTLKNLFTLNGIRTMNWF